MIAKLIEPGVAGEPAREIVIVGDEFLIGRGADCDLRLRDLNISRHHCLIRIRPDEITLSDLGSSNGTYVNGTRVVSQVALKSGDEITVADFHYYLDLGEGDAKLPENVRNVDPFARTFRLSDVHDTPKEPPH